MKEGTRDDFPLREHLLEIGRGLGHGDFSMTDGPRDQSAPVVIGFAPWQVLGSVETILQDTFVDTDEPDFPVAFAEVVAYDEEERQRFRRGAAEAIIGTWDIRGVIGSALTGERDFRWQRCRVGAISVWEQANAIVEAVRGPAPLPFGGLAVRASSVPDHRELLWCARQVLALVLYSVTSVGVPDEVVYESLKICLASYKREHLRGLYASTDLIVLAAAVLLDSMDA